MKRLLVCMLAFMLLLPAASFAAEQGSGAFYGGPKVGLSWGRIHDTPSGFDNERYMTLNIGAFLGYNLARVNGVPLRLEADLTIRGGDEVDGWGNNEIELHSFSTLMGNIWFDIPVNSTSLQPYVGGGLGLAQAYFDARQGYHKENDEFSWALAWNVGAGAVYRLSHNMAIDFGYRYVNSWDFESDVSGPQDYEFKLTSHDLSAGLRFEF